MNGSRVQRVWMCEESKGNATSSWASRYYDAVSHGARILGTLTAVWIRSLSSSSILPPGRAVCPAWVLNSLDRVVKRTRNWPASSKTSTRTAASDLGGRVDLARMRDGWRRQAQWPTNEQVDILYSVGNEAPDGSLCRRGKLVQTWERHKMKVPNQVDVVDMLVRVCLDHLSSYIPPGPQSYGRAKPSVDGAIVGRLRLYLHRV